MKRCQTYILSGLVLLFAAGCSKSDGPVNTPPVVTPALTYPDSIFYVKENVKNNIVLPVNSLPGKYFGFPEGIEIDASSGTIDIGKSETGLRYKMFFIPDGSTDTLQTTIEEVKSYKSKAKSKKEDMVVTNV